MAPVSELRKVIRQLQRLVLELEENEVGSSPAAPAAARTPPKSSRSSAHADGDKWIGELVEITRRDRYYGRVGCVESRRGTKSWNIRLKSSKGKPKEVIYKASTGFKLYRGLAGAPLL